MELTQYCGVPDDILDGIFSTEDLDAWKVLSEKRKMKQATNFKRAGSAKFKIDPSDQTSFDFAWSKDTRMSHILEQLVLFPEIVMNFTLFYLDQCSYFPFLFIAVATIFCLAFTALHSIILSLFVCVSVVAIHLVLVKDASASASA